MTDLEKKIESKIISYYFDKGWRKGKNELEDECIEEEMNLIKSFLKSQRGKELAEWISREAVENCEWFVSPKYDNEEVRFNVDWFDGLWSEK
jgi:hypothetical protein